MTVKRFLVLLVATLSMANICPKAQAQIFNSKAKKALEEENNDLRRIIDSLRLITENSVEIADTASFGDTINPAGIGFFDTEMYQTATAGSNSDSLLGVWYLQQQMKSTEGFVNLDSANLTSNIPDSLYIANIKRMNSVIPIPYNNVVKNYIIFYTQKIPNKAAAILGLSKYYLPIFEEIFDAYDMPKELAAVAIIESALNPFAVSRAKAKGMWQFMYTTAKLYDLEITSYVDERLDPIKSCEAAARYLRDAYAIFGDWALAISSYNCGAGNVNKAIRRAGSKDFWSVYRYLPRETRGYVPSFVGALYLLHYYHNYNIVPDKISMPAHVDTFMIHRNLHFEQIADNLHISKDAIRELNPQYIKDIIPATEKGYILRLPYNYSLAFIDKEEEIYSYKDTIFFNPIVYAKNSSSSTTGQSNKIYHKVRKGQTLSGLAVKYGVTIAQIKKWNNLKGNTIRIGQTLVIYQGGEPSAVKSSNTSASSSSSKSSSPSYQYYTIRKGDTLYGIARKFNMSLSDLLKLNGLTTKSKIYAGKKLKVKA